jgi:hypothetical protein
MKMKQLTLACGLALTAIGAHAATFDAAVGGSSALEPAFKKAAADLCDAGGTKTVFVSTNSVNGAGATGTSVICTVDPAQAGALGVSSGDTIRVFKNSSGSGAGITNVNSGAALNVPDGVVATCTADGLKELSPGKFFTAYKDCKTTTKPVTIGIADVEPKLLAAVGGVTAANAAGVTAAPLVAVQFGVPLNDKAYYALQVAQSAKGIIAASCVAGGANANGGPTDLSQDCAPSISSAQLRGFLTGTATDFGALGADVSTALVANNTLTNVKVCRRGATSGTQATFAARIGGVSCSTSPLSFRDNTNDDNGNNNGGTGTGIGQNGYIGSTLGAYTVVINADSTAVQTCLQTADTNVDGAGQADAALGLLGLDQQPTGSSRWHFAKIDGVYPSNDNLVDGVYDNLFSESVITYKTSAGVPTGFAGGLYSALKASMGSPATISGLTLTGLGAIPNSDLGYAWVETKQWASNPVMVGTRSGDTCRDSVTTF